MLMIVLRRSTRKRLLVLAGLCALVVLVTAATGRLSRTVLGTGLRPLCKVDTDNKIIALTFNVRPGTGSLTRILATLAEAEVVATFFLSGEWAEQNPQTVRQIIDGGHEIGIVGYRAVPLVRLSSEEIREELQRARQVLLDVFGLQIHYLRPADGRFNDQLIQEALRQGLTPVKWSLDSWDSRNASAGFLVRRVISRARPGGIVLLHADDQIPATPEALPEIIGTLKSRGFVVTTLSELLRSEED